MGTVSDVIEWSEDDVECSINHWFYSTRDDDGPDSKVRTESGNGNGGGHVNAFMGPQSLLETSHNIAAIEYKKGYVMRKCCYDSNNKKSKYSQVQFGVVMVHQTAVFYVCYAFRLKTWLHTLTFIITKENRNC